MEEKNIDTEVLEMSPKTSPEKLKQIKELQAKKDAIMLRPDLEEGKAIRMAAKEAGESVSAFVLNSVRDRMAGIVKGQYTVDLGAEMGERTAPMAKAATETRRNDDVRPGEIIPDPYTFNKPCVYAISANGNRAIGATRFDLAQEMKDIKTGMQQNLRWPGVDKVFRESGGRFTVELLEILEQTDDSYRWARVDYYRKLDNEPFVQNDEVQTSE